MVGLRDSSNYWRRRAVRARARAEYAQARAETARSDRFQQKCLKIAKKYDQRADRARERVIKRGITVSDATDLGADAGGLRSVAECWRKRAEYARATAKYARARAEYKRGAWSRQKYLRIAKRYDRRADLAERVEKRIRNRAATA